MAPALLAPLVTAVAVLLVWPLITLATTSTAGEAGPDLSRYAAVLTSARHLRVFAVTALIAVASTGVALALCVPAALHLHRAEVLGSGRGSRLLAVAVSLPLSLPGIVIGFFVILLFGQSGVVPEGIEAIAGAPRLRIAYTATGLLLGYVYFQIPRIILVVRGAARAVSWDAVDAARTLGASTWLTYRVVVIPALRPAIANAAGLCVATAFGAFGTAATLSRGISVVPLEIAATFTDRFRPEEAATLSILLAALTTTVLVGLARLGRTS